MLSYAPLRVGFHRGQVCEISVARMELQHRSSGGKCHDQANHRWVLRHSRASLSSWRGTIGPFVSDLRVYFVQGKALRTDKEDNRSGTAALR
jgi:hypothetical protein